MLQLIADQRPPAHWFGQFWSINDVDIFRHRVPVGRPLSIDMARGLLGLAAGVRPNLSSRDVSRLRTKMVRLVREVKSEGDPAGLLRSWLPLRARRRELSVAEADLSEVLADDRLVISGVSDKRAGRWSPRMGEGYLDEGVARKFLADHFTVEADDRPRADLIVHLVILENWIDSGDYDGKLLSGRSRP